MRWPWLRALVLGLWLGPASPVEAADLEIAASWAVDPSVRRWDGDPAGRAVPGAADPARPDEAAWVAELRRWQGTAGERDHWRTLAARTAAQPSMLTDEIETEIASWRGIASPERSITPLGCALCLLPSLDRTALVSSWAVSPDAPTRAALARALAAPFDAVGVRAALDQLQTDALPEIRRLAASASAQRERRGA